VRAARQGLSLAPWRCACSAYGISVPVKNGYGRSTGTSVVPQIADDFGARRKAAEVGHKQTFRPLHPVECVLGLPYRAVI
jgi:hypothetical protein